MIQLPQKIADDFRKLAPKRPKRYIILKKVPQNVCVEFVQPQCGAGMVRVGENSASDLLLSTYPVEVSF